jgi:hypothetical protein
MVMISTYCHYQRARACVCTTIRVERMPHYEVVSGYVRCSSVQWHWNEGSGHLHMLALNTPVMLLAQIQEVLSSNLNWIIGYPDVFIVSLSPSMRMSG